MSFWRDQTLFKWLTVIEIHLTVALDFLPWLSFNPFKVLVKRNMHAYCIIKILMSNTNDKVKCYKLDLSG